MELEILHAIQNLHCDWLDALMIFFTNLSNHGEVWILIAVILICFKKTRTCGFAMAISLLLMLIIGNGLLKNIFARPRPCWVDSSVKMIIDCPSSYSFPSGHTFSSFAGAFTIFFYFKKQGVLALILASVIGFSRMYLFVHYPTDIFGGIVFGLCVALASIAFVNKIQSKRVIL